MHKISNLVVKQGCPKPWMKILIVPIFKSGDKSIPSNYRTIMISLVLAKLCRIVSEKKINICLESHGKRDKGRATFRRYPSNVDHFLSLRIIAEECHNNKTDLLCCLVEFKKDFDIVSRTSLWNMMEDIKVPFELRTVATRLYETVIAKFRNTQGWSKEINCNIRVQQGCPFPPILFGIYIDN
jgi:hypothetical protein